jgi:hypothetical protein
MAITKEDLDKLNIEYGDKTHEILGAGSMMLSNYSSGSRLIMSTAFFTQRIIPKNPELAYIYTGYDNAFGEYADSLIKSNDTLRVIDVIFKFPNMPRHIYLYIVQNVLTNVYDVIEVSHYNKFSETHGYIKPQTNGDTFLPGSIIPANTIIARAPSHDEYGNYRQGINAKIAYVSHAEVEEDGFGVSDEFAKKTKIFQFDNPSIIVNKNTLLLNLYGDNCNYKGFPDIGEEIKDGVLASIRQINYKYAANELTELSLNKPLDSDKIIPGSGRVVDIDVFINDEEELENNSNRIQLKQYFEISKLYHQQIVKSLGNIMKNKSNIYSFKLKLLYERSRDFLDTNTLFSVSNSVFEFALVNITTVDEVSLNEGYKLTDRFSSKGVICHIIPKENMPRDKWGNVADIIQSPPGIIGRANTGQLYEHEVNFCSFHIRRKIVDNSSKGLEKQFAILFDYLEILNKEYANEIKLLWNNLNNYDKTEYIADIIQNGIYIRFHPFKDNITLEKLDKVYTKFNIKPDRVRVQQTFSPHNRSKTLEKDYLFDSAYTLLKENLLKEKIELNDFIKIEDIKKENLSIDNEYTGNNEYIMIDQNGNNYKVKENNNKYKPITKYIDKSPFEIMLDNWSDETYVKYNDDGTITRSFLTQEPVIIADKYFLILKHMPEGKSSARYIGSTSPLGIPNKTAKSDLRGPLMSTSIRCSEMDLFNLLIKIKPEILYRYLSIMSKNPELRSKVFQKMLYEDPRKPIIIDWDKYSIIDDIPAKVLNAYLYALGFSIIEDSSEDVYEAFDNINIPAEELVEIFKKHRELESVK